MIHNAGFSPSAPIRADLFTMTLTAISLGAADYAAYSRQFLPIYIHAPRFIAVSTAPIYAGPDFARGVELALRSRAPMPRASFLGRYDIDIAQHASRPFFRSRHSTALRGKQAMLILAKSHGKRLRFFDQHRFAARIRRWISRYLCRARRQKQPR